MHRSGTSMITRMLERTGIYFGVRKDMNHESLFFMKINKWLLSVAGASWDSPENARLLWDDSRLNELLKDRIESILKSPFRYQYMGCMEVLRGRGLFTMDTRWGWKDPRNTLTLPVWLSLFPHARVILIRRHGVDVAHSLVAREKRIIRENLNDRFRTVTQVMAPLIPVIRGGIFSSPVCMDMDRAFQLWCRYMEYSGTIEKTYSSQVLSMRYEDFLAEPEKGMRTLTEFAGESVSDERVKSLISPLNPSRAYAYAKNEGLAEFAGKHAEELHRFGYQQ